MTNVKTIDELLTNSKNRPHTNETVASQNTVLGSILQFGELKKMAKEVVDKDNERFTKNYQPRFKTTEDLKDYLLNSSV